MSMIRKSHLSIAFAGLALFAGSQAFACSTSLWGAGLTGGAGGAQSALGGVVAGQPNGGGGGTAIRYSGLCGLRAPASGAMVQDGSPVAEAALIARFYAHVNMTSGTPVIFQAAEGAPDAANARVYAIQYNRANQQFEAVNQAGTVTAIGAAGNAPNNKFYHVHTSWSRATGGLDVTLQGNGANTASTFNLTGFPSSGGAAGPDFVRLGWVSGTAVGTINVDAYESRRSTIIPNLCRGEASGNGLLNVGDRGTVTTEALGGALGTGQPDCNQDGVVNVGDRGCITTRVLAGDTCAVNP
jgi:hypothetical protein